jgi:hypothetical protein
MWRQRPLHIAFTAREPIAYQRSQVIGRFASLPQHEMLAVGESGQNAKNSMRLANKMCMDHRNAPFFRSRTRAGRLWRDIVASFP